MLNMRLLKSFRNNLYQLKEQKKDLERRLMSLRFQIQEYELAIAYIDRNIKRNVNKENKKKKGK